MTMVTTSKVCQERSTAAPGRIAEVVPGRVVVQRLGRTEVEDHLGQDLQRYVASQARVAGAIHLGDPVGPERGDDLVGAR